MKQQNTFWILLLVFVVLIGGAYLLYSRLDTNPTTPQLAANNTQPSTEVTQADTAPSSTDSETTQASSQPPEQDLAPDFTVYDSDGSPVQLSQFFGKPIVLNFWASWCGPCKNEMPDFQALYEIYGNDIHFVMVNMTDGARETQAVAESFLQSTGYTFPVYFDLNSQADVAYQVYSIPTTYILDHEGHLVAKGTGSLTKEALQSGIDMVYPYA